MNAALEKLVENWEAIVGDSQVGRAFIYIPLHSETVEKVKSYKIDSSQLEQLLEPQNLINIRITMGCSEDDLTSIGVSPIFTPIIGGIGKNREEQHFKMEFYPGDRFKDDKERIPIEEAKRYVDNWSVKIESSNRDMDKIFKNETGEDQMLRDYTFDDEDTISIKDFCKGRDDISLFFHLGLESSLTTGNPFKFRTVLEVSRGSEAQGNEEREFYQLSSPCPPNCGNIFRSKPC